MSVLTAIRWLFPSLRRGFPSLDCSSVVPMTLSVASTFLSVVSMTLSVA
ncbi:hypothetical protein ABH966_002532 [Lysinibacillus sp. RC46]